MMSQRQARRIEWVSVVFFLVSVAGAFASASFVPKTSLVGVSGEHGETLSTVPLTWILTGICAVSATISGAAFKLCWNRLNTIEKTAHKKEEADKLEGRLHEMEVEVKSHGISLAEGGKDFTQLFTLLEKVGNGVEHIKSHGCARKCGAPGQQATPQPYSPSYPPS